MAKADLPALYTNAKNALAECLDVDEVRRWDNKAAALATYAKMAKDPTLGNIVNRLRAYYTRRMGELLREFPEDVGGRPQKTSERHPEVSGKTSERHPEAADGQHGAIAPRKEKSFCRTYPEASRDYSKLT